MARRLFAPLLIMMLLFTALSHLALAVGAARPEASILAFLSHRTERRLIHLLDVDYGLTLPLRNTEADDAPLAWSPDGSQIAFISRRDGNSEIYILNLNTGALYNLTGREGGDRSPVWSPDGRQIAYVGLQNRVQHVFVIDAVPGSTPRQITQDLIFNSAPLWTPDGEWLVFVSDMAGYARIYAARPDGGSLRQVLDNQFYSVFPAWSPGGTRIAYDLFGRIQVANAADYFTRDLTTDSPDSSVPYGRDPVWSPDDAHVAFRSIREGRERLFVMNADSSEVVPLALRTGADPTIAWSPDGARIAFVSNHEGNDDIYIINADGTGLRSVTRYRNRDGFPAWQP